MVVHCRYNLDLIIGVSFFRFLEVHSGLALITEPANCYST